MPPAQKVLCVAEKNDAAKNIANILSTGRPTVRRGGATYNMLYCFEMDMDGQRTEVVFTSVSGHMMEQDFGPHMKGWRTSPMLMCFTDPLITRVSEDSKPIEKQLMQVYHIFCFVLIFMLFCYLDKKQEARKLLLFGRIAIVKANISAPRLCAFVSKQSRVYALSERASHKLRLASFTMRCEI